MTNRTRSRSGASTADVYRTEGSKLDLGEIDFREIKGVHDMAATIFAERVGARIRRLTTGDILQSATFGVTEEMPITPSRILAVQLITDNAARITTAALVAQGTFGGVAQEIPICVWDGANSETVRMTDAGAASANLTLLIPTPATLRTPLMLFGSTAIESVGTLALRGDSSAFGAGTVEIMALVFIAHAVAQSGLSSFGCPIPGW